MKFTRLLILVLITTVSSCNDSNKKVVPLRQKENINVVIYRNAIADFLFERNELIDYCKEQNNGEPNDFTYPQIIEYITNFKDSPVIIPDTLGTKLTVERDVMFNRSDSVVRVRDQTLPYAYIIDDVEKAVIDFSRKGQLRIYHHASKGFLDSIIIDDIDTNSYGETNIMSENDSILLSQLRWIK